MPIRFGPLLDSIGSAASKGFDVIVSGFRKGEVVTGLEKLDGIIKDAKITKEGNLIKIEGLYANELVDLLKSGDLAKVLKELKSSIIPSSSEVSHFKKLTKEYPESTLDDLAKTNINLKKAHNDLNIKGTAIDDAPPAIKKKIEKAEKKGSFTFKDGTYIALTIGGVVIGLNWLKKAANDRNGCWLVSKVNGKTTSCKISGYTCMSDSSPNNTCDSSPQVVNTNLVLMHLVNSGSEQQKTDFAEKTGVAVEDLKPENFLNLLSSDKYPDIDEYISGLENPYMTGQPICTGTINGYENGQVPPCRCCDTTADPRTTAFANPKNLGANISMKCVTDATILDVIGDIVTTTGENLLDGATSLIKYLGIAAAVIVLLIIIVFVGKIFINMFSKKQTNNNNINSNSSNQIVV